MLFLLMDQTEEHVTEYTEIPGAPGFVVCYLTDLAEHFGNYALVHYRSGVRLAQAQTEQELKILGQDIVGLNAQFPDEFKVDWTKSATDIFNKESAMMALALVNNRYPESQGKMQQIFEQYFPGELVGVDEHTGENIYERNLPTMDVMYRDRNVDPATLEREQAAAVAELTQMPGVTEEEQAILARPEDEEPDFDMNTMFAKWAADGWANGEAQSN